MKVLTRSGSLVSGLLGRQSRIIYALRPVYEWLLDVASQGRGIEWPVNGTAMRIDPRVRRWIASEVEIDLWKWLQESIRPGEQVLDVGSFLGVYAVFMARWSGPSGRVLAFEPTPRTVSTLRRHVEINGLSDRVKIIPQPVGEMEREVELHEHSEPYRNAIGITDPNGLRNALSRARLTTIDEVCRQERFEPTLLRMDVQGFERSVLCGARETIARGRGRLRIVLEVHPQLWPLLGFDGTDFDRTLAELGLRARALGGGRSPLYVPDAHVVLDYF